VAATQKKTATPKPAGLTAFTIEMDHSKSTKGTQVYTNEGDGVPITTLYIQRSAFAGEPPAQITVSVEAAG